MSVLWWWRTECVVMFCGAECAVLEGCVYCDGDSSVLWGHLNYLAAQHTIKKNVRVWLTFVRSNLYSGGLTVPWWIKCTVIYWVYLDGLDVVIDWVYRDGLCIAMDWVNQNELSAPWWIECTMMNWVYHDELSVLWWIQCTMMDSVHCDGLSVPWCIKRNVMEALMEYHVYCGGRLSVQWVFVNDHSSSRPPLPPQKKKKKKERKEKKKKKRTLSPCAAKYPPVLCRVIL